MSRFEMTIGRETYELASLRHAITRWLQAQGTSRATSFDTTLVAHVVAKNALSDADAASLLTVYATTEPTGVQLELPNAAGGAWLHAPPKDDGLVHGVDFIETLGCRVDVDERAEGVAIRVFVPASGENGRS
jgi:hypothetical protein